MNERITEREENSVSRNKMLEINGVAWKPENESYLGSEQSV